MSSYVYIPKRQIDESLMTAPTKGKHMLEPFGSFMKEHNLPVGILEDSEVLENEAEVHTEDGDLWLALEGETTFICGGEMHEPWVKQLPSGGEDPTQIKAKTISNGDTIVMRAGDWLWIPAGIPHQHTCAGTARLAIIKIPVKK